MDAEVSIVSSGFASSSTDTQGGLFFSMSYGSDGGDDALGVARKYVSGLYRHMLRRDDGNGRSTIGMSPLCVGCTDAH